MKPVADNEPTTKEFTYFIEESVADDTDFSIKTLGDKETLNSMYPGIAPAIFAIEASGIDGFHLTIRHDSCVVTIDGTPVPND